jgi:NodT family efflux transporter outer membrane factor (OMF) lipoprotein
VVPPRLAAAYTTFLTILLTTGCVGVSDRPAAATAPAAPITWAASAGAEFAKVIDHWLASFQDARLTQLVADALAANYDLQASAARVQQALAQARIEGASRLPQVNLRADGERFQDNFVGIDGEPSKFLANSFRLGMDISWELDVWGRIRASRDAARADADSAQSDFNAARLSLAARVAQAWFQLIEARLQVEVAESSLKDRRTIAGLVRGRFELGLSQGLELRLAQTDLATAEAQLAQARNQFQLAQRDLDTLLGRYPYGTINTAAELPPLPDRVPLGLPAQLLERRPDLLAAHARLAAADLRVASAQAALLPRFTLNGGGGVRSQDFDLLFSPASVIWNVAGGLLQPVFTGGRLTNEIKLNEARVTEALANYRQTALTAFREVEQALAAEEWLREQERSLLEAAEKAEENKQAVIYAYRNGLTDILTLLDNYRSVLNTRSDHLAVKRRLLNNRVDLYLALGGGY